VNEKFIPFFFECLSNVQFRREACDCITQVVAKGMPPLQKLDLLVRLKVLELVNSAATVRTLLACLISSSCCSSRTDRFDRMMLNTRLA
jgi:hypothetical protein